MWFFTSLRWWGNQRIAAGKFINKAQGTPFYVPDETQPAWVHEWYESKAVRVTWRATEKNKFNFFVDPQRDCHCPANVASGSINAPEAFFSYKLHPAGLYQATWSAPMTNRLLMEAGFARVDGSWPTYSEPEFNVQPTDVSISNSQPACSTVRSRPITPSSTFRDGLSGFRCRTSPVPMRSRQGRSSKN